MKLRSEDLGRMLPAVVRAMRVVPEEDARELGILLREGMRVLAWRDARGDLTARAAMRELLVNAGMPRPPSSSWVAHGSDVDSV